MRLEGRQFAQYRLVRLLKRGGMGEIYLAEDTKLNRQVAMKVIRTDIINYDDEEEARVAARLFLREAQVVAKLDHPHILPLYDADEEHVGGITLMYMVMPLREESSFADWLRQYQQYQQDYTLAPRIVERIVRQAASALQHAHENSIVHQDVKPSNFLIRDAARQPGQLYVQLADFGVAKLMNTTNQSQIIRGTPTHMAPEQWDGQAVPATDQYALAVMAYELLTGQTPFEGDNHQQMWYQHSYVTPLPPSSLNPNLPVELDAVLLRALAKTPQERYRSISAFALAFRQALLDADNMQQQLAVHEDETRMSTRRPIPQTIIAREPDIEASPAIGQAKGGPNAKAFLLTSLALILIAASAGAFIFTFWHSSNGIIPATSTSKSRSIVQTTGTTPNLTASARTNATTAATAAQATATAQAQASSATATARANATSTAIAERNATATAQTATAVAQATATVTAYNLLENEGTPVLTDPLQDNTRGYNWDITYATGVGGCRFFDGAYQSSVPQPGLFSSCYAHTSNYSNIFYEIQLRITRGDQGGMLFRYDQKTSSFYYFHIDTSGKYALDLYQQDILSKTLTSGTSSEIDTTVGAPNLLAVQANGSAFTLFVNRHPVDSITNDTLSQGQIGVMAYAVSNPTDVLFSNAKVSTI